MKDDVDRLMEVMEAAFDPYWREAWTRRQVEDSLATGQTHAILIDADADPDADPDVGGCPGRDPSAPGPTACAGFVLARHAPGEQELLLIAVHPDHRNKGYGGRLLETFILRARQSGAEKLFLEMRENNPAHSLYRKCGFAPIGRRKAYYRTRDGQTLDAITFGRDV